MTSLIAICMGICCLLCAILVVPTGAFQNMIINHHPCLASLFPEGLQAAMFKDKEVLKCEVDGIRYFLKVRTGTSTRDEATLECLSLAALHKPWPLSNISSYIPAIFPIVYFHRGPAIPEEDSVCVTEYFARSKQTLKSFIRAEVKTQSMLYNFIQAFLDLLLLLKKNHVMHNDLHEGNIVVLRDHQILGSDGERIIAPFSFLIVDFSFAFSPAVPSTPLVDSFARLLQFSGLISATPSGPLCDVYSTGIMIKNLLGRFSLESTTWAYPIVDLMLDRNEHPSTPWTSHNISSLKELLHALYSNLSNSDDDRLSLFSHSLILYNDYRNFVTCGNATESCEELELVIAEGGQTINARLGPKLEVGYAPELGVDYPTVFVTGSDVVRWALLEPVFVELIKKWPQLDVSVLDVSGGYSFVCVSCYFSNITCTVLETDSRYGVHVRRVLETFPAHDNQSPLLYLDLSSQTLENAFEADIITVLGNSLWLHFCVEGNLGHVMKKLAARAREMLILEWVDPADEAIVRLAKQFPSCAAPRPSSAASSASSSSLPTNFSSSAAYSPYTEEEFKKAIQADFCGLTSFSLGDVSDTRYITINMHFARQTTVDKDHLETSYDEEQVQQMQAALIKDAAKQERLKHFQRGLTVYDAL